MPEYLAPGVYVEEISVGVKPIEGVSTTTAAFVGIAEKGPLDKPKLVTSIGDFVRTFGGYLKGSYLTYAVDGFFRNGGKRCYVVRVADSTASAAYADFKDRAGTDLLRISAASEGAWGKDIDVDIQESPQAKTSLYNSALSATASAGDTYFKPKSTRGLKKGDKVKLSNGVDDSTEVTVQSIGSDGKVNFSGSLTKEFPKESSRVMTVLTAKTGQTNTLSVLSTSGFAAKSLVAFREAGQDTVYAQLKAVKPLEKRVSWDGELKDAKGASATNTEVQGANLVDVKRVTQNYRVKSTTGVGKSASVAIADLQAASSSSDKVERIRAGDTLMFGTGKTAESVTVKTVDSTNITVSPALKYSYAQNAAITATTAPQSELFSMSFVPALASTGTLDTKVTGFQIGDQLVFSGGGAGTDTLSVTGLDSTKTKVTLSGNTTAGRTAVVAQLSDKAKGVVVQPPAGFQAGDLVRVKSGASEKVLSIKTVKGNRLVFDTQANWGSDVTKASFVAQKWSETRVNTLEFRIRASYEKGQARLSESFDKLSLDPSSKRYVAKKGIVNEASDLIKVADQRATPISAPTSYEKLPKPTAAWTALTYGGNDGLQGLAASDYIGTSTTGTSGKRTGLTALEEVDEVSMLCIPDLMMTFGGGGTTSEDDVELVQLAMISHCEKLKDRFAILDPINGQSVQKVQAWREDNLDSKYAALYYPWITIHDPIKAEDGSVRFVPPSGHMAGVYARTDIERGVHKAPANEILKGVLGLERTITHGEQEVLNPDGVNCIRQFRGRGIRVWGARTVSSDSEWKYVNVRRLFLFLEESIEEGTQWVVFEPNDKPLWQRVIASVSEFLERVWRDGALMGATAEEAFFVRCDRTTMTENDIKNGRLICLIGVAPVRPAEFVIFRIHQWQGGSQTSE